MQIYLAIHSMVGILFGLHPHYRMEENPNPIKPNEGDKESVWLSLAGVLILLGIIFGCRWGYEALDSYGWIPHTEKTRISFAENWLGGESKHCWSVPVDHKSASITNTPEGYAFGEVDCDSNELSTHEMDVTFWGRKNQPEYKLVLWDCIRNKSSFGNESFVCYEKSGIRNPWYVNSE